MAHTKKRYRKLAKTGGLFAYYSIWQGADHLITAETTMASEEYRRFYYRDIQAIVIRKTAWHHVFSLLFGLPAVLFLILGVFGDGLAYAWLALAVWTGAMLGINLWRGPTCVCHVRTAVQNVRVRALVRLRRVHRVLGQITPLIAQAQGHLPTGPSRADASLSPAPPRDHEDPPAATASEAATAPVAPRLHQVLFGGYVMQALLAGIGFNLNGLIFGLLESLFVIGVMILTFVALARQADSAISPAAKRVTWAGLGFVCLQIASGYILGFWSFTRHPELIGDQWALFEHLVMLSPHDHPMLMGLQFFTLVAALILGAGGLVSLWTHRRSRFDTADRAPLGEVAA
ncbi:MAG: hypothetical protein PVG19_09725 [Desulfobacterales bacterium]|jgi:hypothetical protein